MRYFGVDLADCWMRIADLAFRRGDREEITRSMEHASSAILNYGASGREDSRGEDAYASCLGRYNARVQRFRRDDGIEIEPLVI